MEVNILGTEYEIIKDSYNEKLEITEAHGLCEVYDKKIYIAKIEEEKDSVDRIERYKDKVIRHELVHAFFFESGLEAYARDEELVDWIAAQFPKMYKTFKELNILD